MNVWRPCSERACMCHRQPDSPDGADRRPIPSGPRPWALRSRSAKAQQSASAAFALVNQIHVGCFEFGPRGLKSTFVALCLIRRPEVHVCCFQSGPRPSSRRLLRSLWSQAVHVCCFHFDVGLSGLVEHHRTSAACLVENISEHRGIFYGLN